MKLMILDGNSIINRAYFGVRPLSAPDGTPTNAVFGFMNIFNRLMDEVKPDGVCVSFDVHAPTFRHRANAAYKATRKGMPDDLRVQVTVLKNILNAMNINCYELEGYEADDILGTVGRICSEQGHECVVVTGDKDSLQLVSDKVTVCIIKTRGGQTETTMYTPEVFTQEYGFSPCAMVDLKALMGDSSDNISGVPGIGEKTALELVRTFGGIDGVYDNISAPAIKDSVRKKLEAGEKSARESFWLATIFREVPIAFKPEENTWTWNFAPELFGILTGLGFTKLIERYKLTPAKTAVPAPGYTALPVIEAGDSSAAILSDAINSADAVSVIYNEPGTFEICDGKAVYKVSRLGCFMSFDGICSSVFSPNVKKITHGLKNLQHLLMDEGFSAEGFIFDTELAAYLISSTDTAYTLEGLSMAYLGHEARGAEAAYMLKPIFEARLSELDMEELYYGMELPLCPVLAEMERTGFLVDRSALTEFGQSLTESLDALQESIFADAGRQFNINSPKQLGEVLFDELMLPYGKKTKTGWSTNADVLEKLRGYHPIVNKVLEFRELSKLKSTYAEGLLKVISPDGRIHTNFQMTVTATGRLSSTEPNLQNIPIRKLLGAQIRKMFIAAPGNLLVDADYSQIELRLLAHISGDKAMQEAFASGDDFHARTAAAVFGVPLEEVTPVMRSRAKAVNFGIVYGISSFSLSQDINVTPAEAQAFIDAYFARFPGVHAYMEEIKTKARENGYVSTLFGRRRAIPEISSANGNVRKFGERVALNMPVQGTAADVIKLAMIKADTALKNAGLKASLVLQVHDELIAECPAEEADAVKTILKNEMESAASLSVRLAAETGTGISWAEAH